MILNYNYYFEQKSGSLCSILIKNLAVNNEQIKIYN